MCCIWLRGQVKIHRNLLLACDRLPVESEPETQINPDRKENASLHHSTENLMNDIPCDSLQAPVIPAVDNDIPATDEDDDPTYQMPQRERRKPKRMTYYESGILSCYSVRTTPQLFLVCKATSLYV